MLGAEEDIQWWGVVYVAVCSAGKRISSGGVDTTIRSWELGARKQGDGALVKHETSIYSLAVTADESRLVFGDVTGRWWCVMRHPGKYCSSGARTVLK